jgi:hypothetical protein
MQRLALAALLLAALLFQWVLAHADIYGVGFGDIYLTYDPGADPFDDPWSNCNNEETDPIPPFQEFTWYLVVAIDFADIGLDNQNSANGLQAWEAGVYIADEITVIGSTLHPSTSVNVGQPPPNDPNDSNWIVGTGGLVSAMSTPYAVVEYQGMLLTEATDLEVLVQSAEPSSFTGTGGPGPVPGWVEFEATGECDDACLRQFEVWDTCHTTLMINYTPEPCECRCYGCWPTEETSWGAIKARF